MSLTKKQKLYINTSLANPTLPDTKIAEMIDTTTTMISRWKHQPEFAEAYEATIREQWKDAVKIAKDTMVNLASNGDYKASEFILKTNGFTPEEKVDVNATVNTIKVEILDE